MLTSRNVRDIHKFVGPEILQAMLWSVRSIVKSNRTPTIAGHGYADPGYRPPSLPYVSLVGPTHIESEPRRDVADSVYRGVLEPGHILGAAVNHHVPAGALRLRFDGVDEVVVDDLPAANLEQDGAGAKLAVTIERALVKAATSGSQTSMSEARKAELSQIAVRWNETARQFAISSGRRGILEGKPQRSSVEVLPAQRLGRVDLAESLGLSKGKSYVGRYVMHSAMPMEQAMAVDVRLDVWARSQLDLAALLDGLSRWIRGRGSLLLGAALLAADTEKDDKRLRLLPEGEITHRLSLLHLEAGDSLTDRAENIVFRESGDILRSEGRIHFGAAGGSLMAALCPTPLVPPGLDAGPVAPRGFALAVGFVLPSPERVERPIRLASLEKDSQVLVSLTLAFIAANGHIEAEIVATAKIANHVDGTATASLRMPVNGLNEPHVAHVAVVPLLGVVELSIEEPNGDCNSAVGKSLQHGPSLAGPDMTLTLGGGQSTPFALTFVHLFGEPLGPFDARRRRTLWTAKRWAVGRRIQLAEVDENLVLRGRRFDAMVAAVEGDAVVLDKALDEVWKRGSTVVFADEAFIQRTAIRRKDDLVGRTFRASVDYRIEAVLESEAMASNTPFALEVNIEGYTPEEASLNLGKELGKALRHL